jgi:hypothetical protein
MFRMRYLFLLLPGARGDNSLPAGIDSKPEWVRRRGKALQILRKNSCFINCSREGERP